MTTDTKNYDQVLNDLDKEDDLLEDSESLSNYTSEQDYDRDNPDLDDEDIDDEDSFDKRWYPD